MVHAATSSGVEPKLKGKISREADYDYAYLDWWFIATPEIAHTWGEIYDGFEKCARGANAAPPPPALEAS